MNKNNNDITNKHLFIDDYAFANSSILGEYSFPYHLSEVGNYAFDNCKNLSGEKNDFNLKIQESCFR